MEDGIFKTLHSCKLPFCLLIGSVTGITEFRITVAFVEF